MFKPNVDIIIDEVPKRKRHKVVNQKGDFVRLPTLYDMETVSGKVIINLGNKRKYEHKGIKLELFGTIHSEKDSKDVLRFISLTQELESIGALMQEVTTYPFKFMNVQKQYETYRGNLKSVKYFLKLTIDTSLRTHTFEQEFAVINPEKPDCLQKENIPIKLEVGIVDWLHIVFDLDHRHFGLKQTATGRVTFKKVGIRLNTMEIQIIKKETVNIPGAVPYQTVVARYEIMDGGPIKNETVPIRFFFKPYDLTPTMDNINNKMSVQYFINLVLNDIEDRKYFKQHEIFLHRIEKTKKPKEEKTEKTETTENQGENEIALDKS